MAEINYYLSNKPNKKGECSIIMHVFFNNKRVTVSIKENVLKEKWSSDKQKVKNSVIGAMSFNKKLEKIKEQVNELWRESFDLKNPDPVEVKQRLLEIVNPEAIRKTEIKNVGFYEFAESYILTTQKKQSTLKNYRGTLNHLKGYEKFKGIEPLNFDSFTLEFYNSFYKYLEKEHNLSVNTIGAKIKPLKLLLSESFERGYHKNDSFKSKRFKVVQESSDSIYLTEHELKAIAKLDLSEDKRLDQVRDLFLIGCYTGLRFSDLAQVTKEKINENTLKIKSYKTGELVVIPFFPLVREILEKYSWNLPKPISNQKFNDYLKEIGEMAGINDEVSKDITKGGERVTTNHKKYELIVSHSARRSFASNMYLKGVPSLTIMAITGHKTDSNFMKYIKLSKEQHAEKLREIIQKENYANFNNA